MSHREIRLHKESHARAPVTVAVAVSLRPRDHHAHATLESVREQTEALSEPMDLVIVNDEANGGAVGWALRWVRENHRRFNRVVFAEHVHPTGGSGLMRTALELAETEFVFELDTDYLLFPRCVARCLETIRDNDADRVQPLVHVTEHGLIDGIEPEPRASAPYESWRSPTMWRARTRRQAFGGVSGWGGPSPDSLLEMLEPISIRIPEVLAERRFQRLEPA